MTQKVIKEYYNQLCANKWDSQEEIDKLFEEGNLLEEEIKQRLEELNYEI